MLTQPLKVVVSNAGYNIESEKEILLSKYIYKKKFDSETAIKAVKNVDFVRMKIPRKWNYETKNMGL